MTRRAIAGKSASTRREYWRERIAAHERSGLTIQRFCKEQGLTEQSFYVWRKRLREQEPMRFALVETGTGRPEPGPGLGVEVVLTTGERLRIGTGVDVTVLRRVLEALRA